MIDAADGDVAAAAEPWSDGRIGGQIYRYVTCAAATVDECDQGPDTSATKRITVAVTVENALGPEKPILVSTLVGNPDTAQRGVAPNPLDSPNTTCTGDDGDGDVVELHAGRRRHGEHWYLYDTPATSVDAPGHLGQPRDARDGRARTGPARRATRADARSRT